MRKYKLILLISILLMFTFITVSYASSLAATTASQGAQTMPSSQAATTTASAQGNTVSIENFAFVPETLTIKAGTKVV